MARRRHRLTSTATRASFTASAAAPAAMSFKFLELRENVAFPDAVQMLAQRFGMPLPELEQSDEQRANAAERESLLKAHEAAAVVVPRAAGLPGRRPRSARRSATWNHRCNERSARAWLRASVRDALKQALSKQGFSQALLLRAGLLSQRDDGGVIDRFRNRLMIPIRRETGSVIAFGGRAVDSDQQPKYLNSPETPIYSKSRTLYGLNLSKTAIRDSGSSILVEGYFDFAQVYQAGFHGGRRLVRHGADAVAGAAVTAIRGKGRAQLRPRCGGPGRHREIVRDAGGRGV